MPVKKLARNYSDIPVAVWAIGFGVLLINVSSVIVRSISPIYLNTVLGISVASIGLLEGLVEGLAYLLKAFSGVVSDYLRRRKSIILVGYGLLTLSRPLIALSSSFHGIVTSRILERLGNGIQSTPRDALVADIAPKGSKGACFGLRVTLGTAGSFLGALTAWLLMNWHDSNYQKVFWLASLPGLMAILIIYLFVKEPKQFAQPKDHKPRHPIHLSDFPRLGKRFWTVMIVIGVFMMAQYSDALMVIHAHKNFGLGHMNAPLILMIYNIGYSVASYPIGRLSDRISRYHLLAVGFVLLLIADLLLGFATSIEILIAGVFVSGLQMGITQSLFMALVADTVPEDLRGTGFGVFYLVSAIAILMANWGGGAIAQCWGVGQAFLASFAVGLCALIVLLVVTPKQNRQKTQKTLR